MKIKYVPMILIFLCVYGLLNYYVGNKILFGANNFINVNKMWFWIVFVLIAFSYAISMLLSRYLPTSINTTFLTVGSYWMVIFMYGLLIFPIIDIFNLFMKKLNIIDNMSRLYNGEIILISLLVLLIFVYGSFNARTSYVKTFTVDKVSGSFTHPLNIVMVSDLHLGNLIGNKRIKKMVSEINSLKPDLVIIAGDIVDSDITPFIKNHMSKEFSKINSKYGTYATLGNHDFMTNKTQLLIDELKSNGVNILRNESVLINDSFYVIGRDDISADRFGSVRKPLDQIVHDLEDDKLKIVIDHTPSSINESLKNNIDFHFSGHTHRGQISPANLITKKIFEIDHGHLIKDNLNVIVSSGYGTWGPPIRIGSKSEIVNVKINRP